MHAIDLVDTAGVLCLGAHNLLEDCPHASQEAMVEYWTASRTRLDAWGRQLRAASDPGADLGAPEFVATAEEILLSQPHTRSVAALCVLHDERHGRDESGVVARNVLTGHQEALRRLRMLLAAQPSRELSELCAKTQRWTDMLLGYVLPRSAESGVTNPQGLVIEFAFDAQRVVEFAYDARCHRARSHEGAERLLSAGIRLSLAGRYAAAANPEANRQIAGGSLGLFGPEAFDGFGLLRSTWSRRMERVTDETIGLLEDLLPDLGDRPTPDLGGARW